MFDWINPLYGWLGLGGVIIAACVAVAIYFPPFRKIAIAVAGAVVAGLAIYAKGSKDAAKRKQAEWDKAERKSVDRGNKARADAKRDVASGRVSDKWDRDDL
jgi:hypothetical protein